MAWRKGIDYLVIIVACLAGLAAIAVKDTWRVFLIIVVIVIYRKLRW